MIAKLGNWIREFNTDQNAVPGDETEWAGLVANLLVEAAMADGELDAGERAQMLAECEEAFARYEARIERGVAKEIARMILPQSLYTQAYWTVSLQGVLHFLQQRLKPDAQYEIRVFAEAIRDLVKDDLARVGVTFEDE